MSINNGGSAFPVSPQDDRNGDTFIYAEQGMTLRDYFAAKAMQGFVASIGIVATTQGPSDDDIARYSYDLADAMLRAREAS